MGHQRTVDNSHPHQPVGSYGKHKHKETKAAASTSPLPHTDVPFKADAVEVKHEVGDPTTDYCPPSVKIFGKDGAVKPIDVVINARAPAVTRSYNTGSTKHLTYADLLRKKEAWEQEQKTQARASLPAPTPEPEAPAKQWTATVEPKPSPESAVQAPISPVRAFQQGCFDEAKASNVMGYNGYWQRNLMALLNTAINAKTTRAVLESPDVTPEKFTEALCTTLLEKALAADEGSTQPRRVNDFMLRENGKGPIKLNPLVRDGITKFASNYFNEHWPEVQTQLAQQETLKR
jgi:hypothetical protein